METFLKFAIPPIISMIAVRWVFFRVLRLAKQKGLVDNPDARKLQKEPVPVMGGMAVFFGLIVGMMIAIITIDCTIISPIILCGSIMFFVGMLDDFLWMSPWSRIVIEMFTITCLVLGTSLGIDTLQGLWGIYQLPQWLVLPLTIFAGVGIINAINMIDGVNGLSSGLCILASLMFAQLFYLREDEANCILALCMAASLIPFLLHNVFGKSSKMYIGDSGTMLMGIIVVWFVIYLLNSNFSEQHLLLRPNMNLCAVALSIESVPIFDTLRVMTTRILNGRSPFSPDKTHLHHMFIGLGVSHGVTSISMILINWVIATIAYVSYRMGASLETQLYLVIAAGVILVWSSYWFLHYHTTHKTRFATFIRRFYLMGYFGSDKMWKRIGDYFDKGEIPIE